MGRVEEHWPWLKTVRKSSCMTSCSTSEAVVLVPISHGLLWYHKFLYLDPDIVTYYWAPFIVYYRAHYIASYYRDTLILLHIIESSIHYHLL